MSDTSDMGSMVGAGAAIVNVDYDQRIELIDAATAAHRLGVKRQTLYAYVSRGTLARHPDGRRSLFEAAAIERLARKGRPRRATQRGAVDLTLETSITELDDRSVRYRGRRLDELVRTHAYEEVAELLWRSAPELPWSGRTMAVTGVASGAIREVCARLVDDPAAGDDPAAAARERAPEPDAVARAGRLIVATAVGALSPVGEDRAARLQLSDRPPLRGTIAGRLWPRLTAQRPTPPGVRALNAALVLLADHELAASTLAVRVAASAWASPAAAVLSGLGAVSGALHGSASGAARVLLQRALEVGPERAVQERLAERRRLPGFGHRVYAGVDPRATVLLDALDEVGPSRTRRVARELMQEAQRRTGRGANIDFALAAMAELAAMQPRAGEIVMSISRIAGWLAHAMEEYAQPPLRFRVRAAFVDT